jgi:hypothetical protein
MLSSYHMLNMRPVDRRGQLLLFAATLGGSTAARRSYRRQIKEAEVKAGWIGSPIDRQMSKAACAGAAGCSFSG